MATENMEDSRYQTDNSVSQKQQPKQQLSKSMQHMRFAVTVDPIPHSSTPPQDSSNTKSDSVPEPEEHDAYGVPASIAPIRNPAARSHSPSNNQKRTDPFAFGSRYLEEGDDIFEFNAWDHVSVDASYLDFSASQYEKQRAEPVSDFDRKRYNDQPDKYWNMFYKNNKTNFFKNRKWLAQEFPILDEVTKEGSPAATVLEVGAGAGNSAFPILSKNKNKGLKIHACDFSKKAVELIRGHELYDEKVIQADVWDVASSPESENGGLPPGLQENSVDVVLMIFIFSALSPRQWNQAVRNIWRVLKPGGQVLFRDYGRGDLAQVRFKKGRYMEENFYVRGDGTRVYFFEKEELEEIWGGKTLPQTKKHSMKFSASEKEEVPLDEQLQNMAVKDSQPRPQDEQDKREGEKKEGGDKEGERKQSQSMKFSTSEKEEVPLDEQVQNMAVKDGESGLSGAQDQQDKQEAEKDESQDKEADRPRKLTSREEDPTHTPSFEVVHFGVDRRMLVNRQRRLKMYRCWMQAVFRKAESEPGVSSEIQTSTIKQDKEAEEKGEAEGENEKEKEDVQEEA